MTEYGLEDAYINTNFDRTKWVRFDVEAGKWYTYNPGTSLYDLPISFQDPDFTGTVSVDGNAGLTGTRTIGGYKMTFTKGLLTGFEAA